MMGIESIAFAHSNLERQGLHIGIRLSNSAVEDQIKWLGFIPREQ
jgi:hypothetical protein